MGYGNCNVVMLQSWKGSHQPRQRQERGAVWIPHQRPQTAASHTSYSKLRTWLQTLPHHRLCSVFYLLWLTRPVKLGNWMLTNFTWRLSLQLDLAARQTQWTASKGRFHKDLLCHQTMQSVKPLVCFHWLTICQEDVLCQLFESVFDNLDQKVWQARLQVLVCWWFSSAPSYIFSLISGLQFLMHFCWSLCFQHILTSSIQQAKLKENVPHPESGINAPSH